MGFYRVLPAFTGFCRVLPSFFLFKLDFSLIWSEIRADHVIVLETLVPMSHRSFVFFFVPMRLFTEFFFSRLFLYRVFLSLSLSLSLSLCLSVSSTLGGRFPVLFRIRNYDRVLFFWVYRFFFFFFWVLLGFTAIYWVLSNSYLVLFDFRMFHWF